MFLFYILVFILPLLTNNYLRLLFICLVILLLLIYSLFKKKSCSCKQRSKGNVLLIILFSLYFVILLLSTILSNSPFVALFGDGVREQGLIPFILYLLVLFFLVIYRQELNINRIINWILLGGFLTALFSILEFIGLQPIGLISNDQGIASTMGHPSFYGAYLIFIIPLTWFKIMVAKTRERKIMYLGLCILFIICLFLTQTRAAWLGAMGSLIFWFLVYGLMKLREGHKKLIFVVLIIVFISVVSFSLVLTQKDFVKHSVWGKMTHLLDFEHGSGALRLIWWNNSLELIQESPWLGYGLDNQQNIFIPYYEPFQLNYGRPYVFLDRAHNEYLDTALTTGLLGLASLLTIIIYIFVKGLKRIFNKNEQGKFVILAILTGLVAYLIQALFSFSVTILYVFFWLYVGMLIVLYDQSSKEPEHDVKKQEKIYKRRMFQMGGSLLIILLFIFLVLRPSMANYYQKDGAKSLDRFSFYKIKDDSSKVNPLISYSSQEMGYRFNLVQIYFQLFNLSTNDATRETVLTEVKKELGIIHQRDPHDFHYYLSSGELYRHWASFDQDKFVFADDFYQQTIDYSPKNPISYFLRGKLYLEADSYNEAKKYFYQSLSFYPPLDDERFILEGGYQSNRKVLAEIYYNLYLTCHELGEDSLAWEYKNQAIELDPVLSSVISSVEQDL